MVPQMLPRGLPRSGLSRRVGVDICQEEGHRLTHVRILLLLRQPGQGWNGVLGPRPNSS